MMFCSLLGAPDPRLELFPSSDHYIEETLEQNQEKHRHAAREYYRYHDKVPRRRIVALNEEDNRDFEPSV